jgi:hypothetical protein
MPLVYYWRVFLLCLPVSGARNDRTQQSGQTPDKEVEIKNITVYVSGYTETDTTGMLSPPTVWRQQSDFVSRRQSGQILASLRIGFECRCNGQNSGRFKCSHTFLHCIPRQMLVCCFVSVWLQCSRTLRRRSAAARLLRLWVWIPQEAWMFVCCERCVLWGRCLCDELITRPEESYRLWCVVVCDLETSRMRRPWSALGRSATGKKKLICLFSHVWTRYNRRACPPGICFATDLCAYIGVADSNPSCLVVGNILFIYIFKLFRWLLLKLCFFLFLRRVGE